MRLLFNATITSSIKKFLKTILTIHIHKGYFT
nr:MAG TPA: hypothetical protein [Caudoviricetes sp.]